jgi:hypothetical protein
MVESILVLEHEILRLLSRMAITSKLFVHSSIQLLIHHHSVELFHNAQTKVAVG